MRSIAATLGTPEFVRVRVGIGRPAPGLEAKEHVLHAMGRAELEAFRASIERAAEAVEAVITNGLEPAMNLYNQTGLSADDNPRALSRLIATRSPAEAQTGAGLREFGTRLPRWPQMLGASCFCTCQVESSTIRAPHPYSTSKPDGVRM